MANITATYSGKVLTSGSVGSIGANSNAKSQSIPSNSYVNSYQADVGAYKLHISSVSLSVGQFEGSLSMGFTVRDTTALPDFFNDMTIMNKIKDSKSDTVKNHYAELLTLLALSNEEKDK